VPKIGRDRFHKNTQENNRILNKIVVLKIIILRNCIYWRIGSFM